MRLTLPALTLGLMLASVQAACPEPPAAARAIRSRVRLEYPPLARNMHLAGDVTILVTVSPEGLPIKAHAIAGHPLLIGAAESCVLQWRFVPAAGQSEETINFHFSTAP